MGIFSSKKGEKDSKDDNIGDKNKTKNKKKEKSTVEIDKAENVKKLDWKKDLNQDILKYIKGEKEESNEEIFFNVKIIENQYIKLQREIQQISLDKIEDDENTNENKCLENYLKKIKLMSAKALEISIDLKIALFEEFKRRHTKFANLKLDKNNFVDPGCRSEFSSWCKNNIKDEIKFIEDFCQKNKSDDYNEEDLDIFVKLTGIYLECGLCDEKIEFIPCNNDDNFDNKSMYDLAEVSGNKKKVKFYVLPGLYYNGDYFKNGKINVFAYSIKDKKFN